MLKIEPNGETYLTRGDTAFIKPIIEVEDEEKSGLVFAVFTLW